MHDQPKILGKQGTNACETAKKNKKKTGSRAFAREKTETGTKGEIQVTWVPSGKNSSGQEPTKGGVAGKR